MVSCRTQLTAHVAHSMSIQVEHKNEQHNQSGTRQLYYTMNTRVEHELNHTLRTTRTTTVDNTEYSNRGTQQE